MRQPAPKSVTHPLIMLVDLLGMSLPDYVEQIGLRYLVIPAMVIAAGIVADDAMKSKCRDKILKFFPEIITGLKRLKTKKC